MLEALFPRQIPTVPVSSYPVTTQHKGWHPAAQPRPAQPAAHSNGKFSIFTASLWMGGQIPSCLNCPLSAAAAGRVTKPHMKNVVNTSLRAAPLIIFWRELRFSVPLHTRCDRRVRDVCRCSRWRVSYMHLVVFFTAIISIDRVSSMNLLRFFTLYSKQC